jgi:hypothetical protein
VQPGPDLPGDLGDPALDGGVDVLVAGRPGKRPRSQLRGDGVEGGQQGGGLVRVEEAAPGQPPHMGARPGQIVAGEAAVVGKAHCVVEQLLGG